MEEEIRLGCYKHYKTGNMYFVTGVCTFSEGGSTHVAYHNMKGQRFTRPLDMFMEEVDFSGHRVKRFQPVLPGPPVSKEFSLKSEITSLYRLAMLASLRNSKASFLKKGDCAWCIRWLGHDQATELSLFNRRTWRISYNFFTVSHTKNKVRLHDTYSSYKRFEV